MFHTQCLGIYETKRIALQSSKSVTILSTKKAMQSIKFRATSFVVFYSLEVIDHLCRIEKTSREDACVYLNVSDERAAVPLQ